MYCLPAFFFVYERGDFMDCDFLPIAEMIVYADMAIIDALPMAILILVSVVCGLGALLAMEIIDSRKK